MQLHHGVEKSLGLWKESLIQAAKKFDFPVHKPVIDLTTAQYNLLWTGNEYFSGHQ